MQQFETAVLYFENVLSSSQNEELRANALLKIADAYYSLGQYQEAIEYYTRLLSEYPESNEAIDGEYNRLLTYVQAGEQEEYVLAAEQFLQAHLPDDPSVANTTQNSEKTFREHPQTPAVLYQFGEFSLEQQQFEKAISLFLRLLSLYPEHELADESLYGVGWCYFKAQQYPEAMHAFEEFLSRFPESEHVPDAYYGLGTASFMQHNYAAAITQYTLILKKFPDYSLNDRVMLNLGTSLINTGIFDEAVEILQQSLDRYPQQPFLSEVNLKTGYALQKLGEYEQAIPHLGQAVAGSDPNIAAEAQFRIGECYAHLQERDKAIVDYLKVVYLYPEQTQWVSQAQFRAANMYEEIGKEEEAMLLYQKILDTSQNAALIAEAQQRIIELNRELPSSRE
jgi:tetratricopeptide (TPR) repeat protein